MANTKQKKESGIVGIGGGGGVVLLRFVVFPFALLLLCLNEAAIASSGWSAALAIEEIVGVEGGGGFHHDRPANISTTTLVEADKNDLINLIRQRKAEIYRDHNIFPDEEYGNEHQEEYTSELSLEKNGKQRRTMLRKRTVEERREPTDGEGRDRALEEGGSIIGNYDTNILPEALNSFVYEASNRVKDVKLPGKKGIGLTLRDKGEEGSWVQNMPKVIFLKPYWNYSWNCRRVAAQPDDIEYVPMIWGASASNMDGVRQRLQEDVIPLYKSRVVKRLLGFNEPDNSEQADMKVNDAASIWPILESTGMPLASPAVTHNAEGGKWMREFMYRAKNRNYRTDYIAVHWYEQPSPNLFKWRMEAIYDLHGGKPLLITEMAVADWYATTVEQNRYSRKQVLEFMKIVLPWMESQDWIVGYAWFPFKATRPEGACSSLFRKDGTPTALGLYYASVTNENPQGDQSIEG